jgi:hypothetical protein
MLPLNLAPEVELRLALVRRFSPLLVLVADRKFRHPCDLRLATRFGYSLELSGGGYNEPHSFISKVDIESSMPSKMSRSGRSDRPLRCRPAASPP